MNFSFDAPQTRFRPIVNNSTCSYNWLHFKNIIYLHSSWKNNTDLFLQKKRQHLVDEYISKHSRPKNFDFMKRPHLSWLKISRMKVVLSLAFSTFSANVPDWAAVEFNSIIPEIIRIVCVNSWFWNRYPRYWFIVQSPKKRGGGLIARKINYT